ncbi:MAG: hypothetical protein ACFFB3_19215 [Candidatus Hodarchaeota archaeon]
MGELSKKQQIATKLCMDDPLDSQAISIVGVASLMGLRDFLETSNSASHEIKTIWSSKVEALTDRLNYFCTDLDSATSRWDVRSVRYWGLKAAISFIQLTPYLYHTPASLRALFTVPTRSQRKKGKYSSANLRRIAKKRGFCPDWSILDKLEAQINKIHHKHSDMAELLLDRIENAKKRSIDFIAAEWASDHSTESLKRLEELLTNIFPDTVISESKCIEEYELTPDLILRANDAIIYVELKEWESDFQLLFKPTLQIFRYGLNADAVIFVLVGNPPTIFDELQGTWTGLELLKKLEEPINTAKTRIKGNESFRKACFMFLKNLDANSLEIPEICTLITIIEEILGEELGISAMEYSSARELQMLLENVSSTQITIRNCSMNRCNGLNLSDIIEKGKIQIYLIKGFR